jgi:protein ImuA
MNIPMNAVLKRLEGARQLLAPISGENRRLAPVPLGHDAADMALRGGLLRGALHEVFAGDASASAAGLAAGLARRAGGAKRLLWIRQDYAALEHGEICASGFAELGLDPASLLMLRAADATDALRAAGDALNCAALGAVIVETAGNPKVLDLVASRRLVLGTQNRNVTAILLRLGATVEPSAAETRWLIRAAPSAAIDDWGRPRFDAALTRNRHGETGRWVMEWSCDDGVFRKPQDDQAAHPGAVAAASADRSAA